MPKIKIDSLADVISSQLVLYDKSIREKVDEIASSKVKKLVKRTKDSAPVGDRKKHYKDSITSKKLSEGRYLWYVKAPNYRLSHLLNNGHATRNGGRVQGTNFIGIANDEIQKEYEDDLSKEIKNVD